MNKKIIRQLFVQKWAAITISLLILFFLIYGFINGSQITNLSQSYDLSSSLDHNLYQFLLQKDRTQKEKLVKLLSDFKYIIEENEYSLVEKINSGIKNIDSLYNDYNNNLTQIEQLADNSILQSNKYIDATVKKLANLNTRQQVTTLERMVVIGASLNTNVNHKIKELALVLHKDTLYEQKLIQLLDLNIENAIRDIKRLKGTPFGKLPQVALKSNKKIKELVLENIKLNKEIKATSESLILTNNQLNSQLQKDNKKELNITLKSFSIFSTILMLLVFISSIFSAIYATKLSTLFNRHILSTVKSFRKIKKGIFDDSDIDDLKNLRNEIGFLAKNLSFIINKLGVIIKSSKKNADELRISSENMSTASENLSQNTAEGASSMEESSSAIEEMSANLEAVAVHSKNVEQKIKEGNEKVKIVSKVVEKTAKSLKDNAEISNVIKAISHKIDILSINAAIEAARAGSAGSGFSVIAEEIRKLSDMTQVSAEKIEKMALDGEKMANNSLQITTGLVIEIEKVVNLVVDLESSIEEIRDGAGQISSSTTQLNQTTQENAQLAEELAQQSEQIKELSNVLDFGDELFHVEEEEENEEFKEDRKELSDTDILLNDKKDEEKSSNISIVDLDEPDTENSTKDSVNKKEKLSIDNILKSEDDIDDEFERMV